MFKNLIYLCLAVLLFTACGDDPVDPCAGVDCGPNGTCVDGTCDCEEGYYGDTCENLLQDLFIGTWSGLDCDGDDYSIAISAGATLTDLIIFNGGLEFEAMIESETMFNVPTQTITEPFFQTQLTVFGNGVLQENGKLSFTADVQSVFGGGVCTSEMTKQ